jgi:VanZ family protein
MTSKKSLFNSYIPAILWSVLVLAILCTPGEDLPKLGSWTEYINLDKFVHIGIFGLMAFLFMRPGAKKDVATVIKKNLFLKIAIAVSLWGLTTEFIQHFWIPGRSFDLLDFVADAIGCFAAFAYCKRYFLR